MTRARASAHRDLLVTQLVMLLAIVLGGLVVVFRTDLLPARFFYDSIRIQAEAAGSRNGPTDESFTAIASFYRVLGLANHPDLAAIFGFVAVIGVVALARRESQGARARSWELSLTFATVLLGSIYLANYSKDIVLLAIAGLCMALGPSRRAEVVFVSSMLFYGWQFREYWLLVAAFYVGLRAIWSRLRRPSHVLVVTAVVILVGATVLFFVFDVDPDHFRQRVNSARMSGVDASTMIAPILTGGGLAAGAINVLVAGAFIVVPIPLVLLGSAYHLAVAVLLLTIWAAFARVVRATFRTGMRADSHHCRGICLVVAFVATQALFEPDYGSALRHLTPLLPVILTATIRSDRKLEHARKESLHGSTLR